MGDSGNASPCLRSFFYKNLRAILSDLLYSIALTKG